MWKHVLLRPIAKPGHRNPSLPSSYRPISLLCVASKITENVVKARLQWELERRSMLNHQYASCPGISTTHALTTLLQKGKDAIARKQEVALITIDVGGAFNQIDHAALISCLQNLGLNDVASWINKWLSDRSFAVRFEESTSNRYLLGRRGIPQGSPLSPILWCLYLDSFFQQLRRLTDSGVWETGAYMDDLFVLVTAPSKRSLLHTSQLWLDTLGQWCEERGLHLDKPSYLLATASASELATSGDGLTSATDTMAALEPSLADHGSLDPLRELLPSTSSSAGVPQDTLSLHLRDGARLDPSRGSIRFLGMDVGPLLNSFDHIRRKCSAARSLAQRLRWVMRNVGAIPLTTRLKVAKMYILPILDYGSPLHPRMRRSDEAQVSQADKDILSFVLNIPSTSSFPSALALSHELGQFSTLTRWRLQSLLFGIRILQHPSHRSSINARDLFGTINTLRQTAAGRASEEKLYGTGNLVTLPAAETRRSLLHGPKIGPLRLAARSIPYYPLEQIPTQPSSPWQWDPLSISILDSDNAKRTEAIIRKGKAKYSARVYTDGSFTPATDRRPAKLGAAALLTSSHPPSHLTSVEALHADRWGIVEAELQAILLGLWLCHPEPGKRGWNRIDVFTDSQTALHRLASPWREDFRPLRHLTLQIRQEVASLRERFVIPINFWWIPGHADIWGNEQADRLAAQASERTPSTDPPPFGASKASEWARKAMLDHERQSWPSLAAHSILEITDVFDSTNLSTFVGLTMRLTSTLLKFRSCTIPVADHRDTSPGESLAICQCGAPWQDRDHLLLSCPLILTERLRVQRHLPPPQRNSVKYILLGGAFPDAKTRPGYLADLEGLLNACMNVLKETCIANGVLTSSITHLSRHRRLGDGALTFLPDRPASPVAETRPPVAAPLTELLAAGSSTFTFATVQAPVASTSRRLYLDFQDSDSDSSSTSSMSLSSEEDDDRGGQLDEPARTPSSHRRLPRPPRPPRPPLRHLHPLFSSGRRPFD